MIPFYLISAIYAVGLGNVLYFALTQAYTIRMHAIEEYGRVIHEFDPYFNYRATEYLWQHGWYKFRTWFDYASWYPLGRPVGTTIYPGMQVTSVLIKKYVLPEWSINDICCFVPSWFGVLATLATAFLAYECSVGFHRNRLADDDKKKKSTTTVSSKSNDPQDFSSILNDIPVVNQIYQATIVPLWNMALKQCIKLTGAPYGLAVYNDGNTIYSTPALEAAIVTALCMSMVPAHLMRSVGGGYDNESIAVFAMTFTFYCWVRSLRGGGVKPNYGWAIASGFAYFYMVAAWGGYVFVLNLIGVHASVLVAMGRYSKKLYVSYTLFYGIGTFLAIQVPVVGWTPLKSLEQMGPLLAFCVFQLLEVCQIILRKTKQKSATGKYTMKDWIMVHAQVFGAAASVALVVAYFLNGMGYFGPISSRVRGLFVKHTKTGNPLVDSVAEHQPANAGAYEQYLTKHVVSLCPIGLALVAFTQFHDASSFLVVYGLAAYFFSNKMVRLILLTAPIASVLVGITLSHAWAWGMTALLGRRPSLQQMILGSGGSISETTAAPEATKTSQKKETKVTTTSKKGGKSNSKKGAKTDDDDLAIEESSTATAAAAPVKDVVYSENILVRLIRLLIFGYFFLENKERATDFYNSCHELSGHLSHPSIIQKGRTQDGRVVTIDDYREAYWWLRDNTPEDARILSWWDYGYQIAGIANRTTIADGNTWNHEHIALLGRTLTSSVKEGHRIARHLADYVLIWTGGGGDDVAKSPHMRRIANSVYRFLCPNDPTCRSFGVDRTGGPSATMANSLLFQLHSTGLVPGVEADKNRFKLVKETKNGKVRIFKILSVSRESKQWVLDNRICDAPGSWYCRGQYPPALQKILKEKTDFAQLEDFNRKGEKDADYTKQYLDNLNNPEKARRAAERQNAQQAAGNGQDPTKRKKLRKLTAEEMQLMNNPESWGNNDATTAVWEVIHKGEMKLFRDLLVENPELAHLRSEDGRGPLWWAYEYGRADFIKLLTKLGVKEDLTDAQGLKPRDMEK